MGGGKVMEVEILELRMFSESQDKCDFKADNEYTMEQIADTSCILLNISLDDLKSKSRNAGLVRARMVVMCKMINLFTLEQVGKFFNRHHSTVIHARDKVLETTKWNDKQLFEAMQTVGLV